MIRGFGLISVSFSRTIDSTGRPVRSTGSHGNRSTYAVNRTRSLRIQTERGLRKRKLEKATLVPGLIVRGRISIPFPCEHVFKKDFGLENVLKKGIGLRKKNVLKTMAYLVMEPHGLSSHGAHGLSSSWSRINDFKILMNDFLSKEIL
ncbi:hypothetical protein L484_014206 [Morus notabilis]|uniref:Uncharacterized protein n=1 Tax=Morus notabilis TaxID=981085 RepID=W9RS31_9ROSA|nr:hypothetical protein L484_014206 [Morus notabilis]